MKKILFMMGVAALTLASCSQDEMVSANTDRNSGSEITFRVRSHKASRAMEFSTYNLDDFMVFGFKGDPEEEDLTSYFDGGLPVKFSRGNDLLFTSATPYYYPVDGSWLHFAAYAPSNLEFESFGNRGGIKMDNFTVEADITKQVDLIFASSGSNLEPDDPDMEMTFEHALTKVYISELRNNDTRYKYEIMGVKFANIHNTGTVEYGGERALAEENSELINGQFRPDGYIQDVTGYGIFWKPTGTPSAEMTYIFSEPVVLNADAKAVDVMSGNDTQAAEGENTGAFMFIPQQLSATFLNNEGNLNSEFSAGMSYIAFLMRITYLVTGEVVYPYAEGVDAISQTIGEGEDAVTYAWAAFPVSTLWAPGSYVDYIVDFSKGAGFVAPGAEEHELQPILGREIKFTTEVFEWRDYTWSTVEQDNQVNVDGADDDDPFGDN